MKYGNKKWFSRFYETTIKGEHTATPLSIQFGKLGNYNSEWGIERIILFEYFLMLSNEMPEPFYHQKHIIESRTRLSIYIINKEIEYFKELGILTVISGDFNKSYYTIDKKRVILSIDEILNLDTALEEEKSFWRNVVAKVFAEYLGVVDEIDWTHYHVSLVD